MSDPQHHRHDLVIAALLTLLAACAPVMLRAHVDLAGLALGDDPPLWCLTTLNMLGRPGVGVPPLFPMIASVFVRLG
jgi:hypothetical protein